MSYLSSSQTASAASCEVLMRQSRRRTAISQELAINRASACREVTRPGAPLEEGLRPKRDAGYTARMWKSLTKATISLIPSRVTSATSVFALLDRPRTTDRRPGALPLQPMLMEANTAAARRLCHVVEPTAPTPIAVDCVRCGVTNFMTLVDNAG